MDEQRHDNQLEPIYNSSVPIQDVPWKTSREEWTIGMGGERGSGRAVLTAQPDDDDLVLTGKKTDWCLPFPKGISAKWKRNQL